VALGVRDGLSRCTRPGTTRSAATLSDPRQGLRGQWEQKSVSQDSVHAVDSAPLIMLLTWSPLEHTPRLG
jgi:hypothetical protein